MISNPILTGFNPDPSICRVGEDYYIATSTFEWFPGVMIYHSRDLENWKLVCRPINRKSQINMLGNPDSGGVWAPCLSYSDGKFWLIYSDVKEVQKNNWKDTYNYLITCDTIDGEWTDPVFINNSGFDPSLFHDDDGRKYFLNMVWDYRVSHHKFYGIVLQEYSHEEKKLIGESKIIFKGTDMGLTEAPHLYKINGFYYLLTAEGGTKYEHASTIARSKTIDGTYEVHPKNPLISSWAHPRIELQKAGHGSIVHTHTDEWYFVHLMGRPLRRPNTPILENRGYCPLGRETSIQKMYWENDWPYITGGNFPQNEVESPNMKEHKWEPTGTREDFNTLNLPMDFQTLRIPFDNELGSLKDRPGFLRLFGRESFNSKFYKSLVARRWQDFNFEATTSIEFEPVNFLQLAGMTNYYNTKNWSSIHVTYNEEKGRIIDILDSDDGVMSMPIQGNEILIPEKVKTIFFKTIVNFNNYQYAFSFDGKKWETIDYVLDSLHLSDDYVVETQEGFFTGAFVGVFAIDTSGLKLNADFDFFDYAKK